MRIFPSNDGDGAFDQKARVAFGPTSLRGRRRTSRNPNSWCERAIAGRCLCHHPAGSLKETGGSVCSETVLAEETSPEDCQGR